MDRALSESRLRNWVFHAYVIAVAIAGFWTVAGTVSVSLLVRDVKDVVFFLALFVFAEILYVPLPKGGGVSVGFAITLACLSLKGPGTAALVTGFGIVLAMPFSSGAVGIERYVFNFGQMALASFWAGAVFALTGGNLASGSIASNAFSLLSACVVYFCMNAGLVTTVISLSSGRPFSQVWSATVKGTVTSYWALIPLGTLVALVYRSYGVAGSLLLLVPLLFARYSFLRTLSVRKASLSVTQAMAAALEAKDAYTKGHSDRVATYAIAVAQELRLSDDAIETIRYAAEMHDVGKIGVREALLNKPGSLTESELDEVRQHASIGANMLKGIEFFQGVSQIVKFHHEWFDGSKGYPQELVGTQIPVGARILMVCDSFDAMTSDRPYRKRIDTEEALRRLRDGAGTQFDPEVVEAFIRFWKRDGAKLC